MSDEDQLARIADALWRKPAGTLTPAQQAFMLVWELEMEVNNGGFELYFSNGPGRDAPRAEAALQSIGAPRCADLVGRAFRIVDRTGLEWADDAQRRSRLDEVIDGSEAVFDELDGKFYEYPDPLGPLLAAFVKKNPREF